MSSGLLIDMTKIDEFPYRDAIGFGRKGCGPSKPCHLIGHERLSPARI